jgi:hypothetical protein
MGLLSYVPKPDGSLRVCINYRALNKVTLKISILCLELRTSSIIFQALGTILLLTFPQVIISCDYLHLIFLKPHSILISVSLNGESYLYTAQSNAPAVFQSVMNRLFSPYLKFVFIHLDDILIFSKTAEEHYAHFSQVLSCLRQHGLKAKMFKCNFYKAELLTRSVSSFY